jgi:hypothetical protein
MAGKISRSPFNERYELHTMAKLSQCQRYTRYPYQKGWEVVYTGGTEATASIYLSVAFIYSTIQNKPVWLFSIFSGSNKCLVRKPFPIPKNEHSIAWVNKSYATALDLNLGYYTIKIGLRCIQNLCHQLSFLGLDRASTTTRINNINNIFSWQANCWS